MLKRKLAIVTTHPIQYNAPLFKLLAERGNIHLKVFYTWSQASEKVHDEGFGKEIQWDIPLLAGYEYEFIINTAKKPGNKSFYGIVTPGLIPAIEAYHPDAVLINNELISSKNFKNDSLDVLDSDRWVKYPIGTEQIYFLKQKLEARRESK